MKRRFIKIPAIFLVLTLMISMFPAVSFADSTENTVNTEITDTFSYLTSDTVNPDELSNSVIIPGVFQSRVRLYNDDGTVAVNSDGEEYSAPFFLDSTSDIVKTALKSVLIPLLTTLITQHDFGNKLSKNFGKTLGKILGEKVKSDSEGNFVYNLKADYYDGSIADLRAEGRTEDIEYIYDQIPISDYAQIAGEDHLYFFSYASFGNIDSIVDDLYKLIEKAAENSPTGKANIIPISQGGSLANDLLERYPQVGEMLDRIIYIVPALDGTVLLGEIYENGIIDDDASLYNEIFPILLDSDSSGWTGSLVNIVLRLLPNEVLNNILDESVDSLVGEYLRYSTCMWALIPQANYEGAAAKYLNNPEDQTIRAQTDAFHIAQQNSKKNIMNQIETYGVKVFDIVDYNYSLYPICDSWKTMNADGIIQVDSTSIGATSVAVDTTLPDDYVPAISEKYIDKYNLIDAGTGLLPDTTFYFHNQNHESTARNDVIIKLSVSLLTDNSFVSIDTYPDKYPQFNEGRNSKKITLLIEEAKAIDTSALSQSDAEALSAAVAAAESQLDNTVVDADAFANAQTNLQNIIDKINGNEDSGSGFSDALNSALTKIFKYLSNSLFNTIGGKGFSDIFRIK